MTAATSMSVRGNEWTDDGDNDEANVDVSVERVFTVVDNYTFCFVSVFDIFCTLFLLLLLLFAYFYELIILMNARLAEAATMCHNKKVESIFVAASLAPS